MDRITAHVLATAKAYAALVGSLLTALVAEFGTDLPHYKVIAFVIAVCTALGTWAAPYAPNADTTDAAGEE